MSTTKTEVLKTLTELRYTLLMRLPRHFGTNNSKTAAHIQQAALVIDMMLFALQYDAIDQFDKHCATFVETFSVTKLVRYVRTEETKSDYDVCRARVAEIFESLKTQTIK